MIKKDTIIVLVVISLAEIFCPALVFRKDLLSAIIAKIKYIIIYIGTEKISVLKNENSSFAIMVFGI